jgi:hypothetical protein
MSLASKKALESLHRDDDEADFMQALAETLDLWNDEPSRVSQIVRAKRWEVN